MERGQGQPVTEEPKTVGGAFSAAIPAAIAAGMVAISGMLISMQVQSARIEATLVQVVKSIEELKSDARSEIADLDRRVRALEINR